MNENQPTPRRHLTVLLGCLLAEVLAVAAFRTTTWNQLGSMTRIIGGGIILSVPMFVTSR